ncbi:unnamed protein product, partial [Polarella glacialis]
VVLSDLGELQAEATKAHIAMNQPALGSARGAASYATLDWDRLPDRAAFGYFDVVFAGDVIWHETLVEPFLKALSWAASGPGLGEAVLSHKVRDKESVDLFEK